MIYNKKSYFNFILYYIITMSLIIIPLNDKLYPVRQFLTPELVEYIEKLPVFTNFIKEIVDNESYKQFIKLTNKQQLELVKPFLSTSLFKQLNKIISKKKSSTKKTRKQLKPTKKTRKQLKPTKKTTKQLKLIKTGGALNQHKPINLISITVVIFILYKCSNYFLKDIKKNIKHMINISTEKNSERLVYLFIYNDKEYYLKIAPSSTNLRRDLIGKHLIKNLDLNLINYTSLQTTKKYPKSLLKYWEQIGDKIKTWSPIERLMLRPHIYECLIYEEMNNKTDVLYLDNGEERDISTYVSEIIDWNICHIPKSTSNNNFYILNYDPENTTKIVALNSPLAMSPAGTGLYTLNIGDIPCSFKVGWFTQTNSLYNHICNNNWDLNFHKNRPFHKDYYSYSLVKKYDNFITFEEYINANDLSNILTVFKNGCHLLRLFYETKQFCHWDLHSNNILVNPENGEVKLFDFDLSSVYGSISDVYKDQPWATTDLRQIGFDKLKDKFSCKPVLGHLFDYWRFIILNVVQYKNLRQELTKQSNNRIIFEGTMDIDYYPPIKDSSNIQKIIASMKSLITYFVEHGILMTSPHKYYDEDECVKIKELQTNKDFESYNFNDVTDILLYFNDIL